MKEEGACEGSCRHQHRHREVEEEGPFKAFPSQDDEGILHHATAYDVASEEEERTSEVEAY